MELYGEPYARYTWQQSSNLNLPLWTDTTITNLRSADSPLGMIRTNLPTTGGPQRYYRAVQPLP